MQTTKKFFGKPKSYRGGPQTGPLKGTGCFDSLYLIEGHFWDTEVAFLLDLFFLGEHIASPFLKLSTNGFLQRIEK